MSEEQFVLILNMLNKCFFKHPKSPIVDRFLKKENAYFCSDFFVHKISSVYILYKQDVHASQTKALDKKEEKEEKIKLQCLKEKGKKSCLH